MNSPLASWQRARAATDHLRRFDPRHFEALRARAHWKGFPHPLWHWRHCSLARRRVGARVRRHPCSGLERPPFCCVPRLAARVIANARVTDRRPPPIWRRRGTRFSGGSGAFGEESPPANSGECLALRAAPVLGAPPPLSDCRADRQRSYPPLHDLLLFALRRNRRAHGFPSRPVPWLPPHITSGACSCSRPPPPLSAQPSSHPAAPPSLHLPTSLGVLCVV